MLRIATPPRRGIFRTIPAVYLIPLCGGVPVGRGGFQVELLYYIKTKKESQPAFFFFYEVILTLAKINLCLILSISPPLKSTDACDTIKSRELSQIIV